MDCGPDVRIMDMATHPAMDLVTDPVTGIAARHGMKTGTATTGHTVGTTAGGTRGITRGIIMKTAAMATGSGAANVEGRPVARSAFFARDFEHNGNAGGLCRGFFQALHQRRSPGQTTKSAFTGFA